MDLNERKMKILKSIIDEYIVNGEPVGSKHLVESGNMSLSPATIRNEMSELCALGLLTQPHTSAGRVPTREGYRLYVNSLMSKKKLGEEIKEYIRSNFKEENGEPESIPSVASKILTSLTGYPAISCVLTEKSPRFKRIELVDIGKSSLMLLCITDDGRSRSRIFRKPGGFSQNEIKMFLEICKNKIKGKSINKITKGYIQGLVAGTGICALDIAPLFTALFDLAKEIEEASVTLNGENALYNICGDELEARNIMSLIKNKDPMLSILSSINEDVSVVFGGDTGYIELNRRTLIAAKFKGGDKYKGYIGILGSNRMNYDKIIPIIEYMAPVLSEIMTQVQQDLEE